MIQSFWCVSVIALHATQNPYALSITANNALWTEYTQPRSYPNGSCDNFVFIIVQFVIVSRLNSSLLNNFFFLCDWTLIRCDFSPLYRFSIQTPHKWSIKTLLFSVIFWFFCVLAFVASTKGEKTGSEDGIFPFTSRVLNARGRGAD